MVHVKVVGIPQDLNPSFGHALQTQLTDIGRKIYKKKPLRLSSGFFMFHLRNSHYGTEIGI